MRENSAQLGDHRTGGLVHYGIVYNTVIFKHLHGRTRLHGGLFFFEGGGLVGDAVTCMFKNSGGGGEGT